MEWSPSLVEGLHDVLGRSRAFGFLGPGPVEAHVEHARAMAEAVGEVRGSCVDLGSGGGVPGLVLAAMRPESTWCLLDSAERRVAFLEAAVVELGWVGRVRALAARAEDALRAGLEREAADLVTARGFGPPAVTSECAAPLVAIGGRVVVSEPPGPFDPDRWPSSVLEARLGLRPRPVHAGGFGFVVLDKVAPCDPALPRRVGLARRRPLF